MNIMTDTTPIPKEALEAHRRQVKQRIAAALINGMAETGATVELVAERLGATPAEVQGYLMKLILGKPIGGFDLMCDIAYAMGCTVTLYLDGRRDGGAGRPEIAQEKSADLADPPAAPVPQEEMVG